MIKKSILTAALLLGSLGAVTSFAQGAHETSVQFMKVQQNAVQADYPLPKDVLEAALRARLEKEGFSKRSSDKGYTYHKGVMWTAVSADKVDVYYRVDGKGDNSAITMLVSKGYDNFITSAKDADMVTKVQAFLNTFINDALAYQLRLAVEAQEKIAKKAEGDYNESVEDGTKLVKKKEEIEKDIAANTSAQATKQGNWKAEKDKLDELKKQVK